MDTIIVSEAAQAAMAGTKPFPEIVADLIGTGVEFYHVDYIALTMTFYGEASGIIRTPLIFEDLPGVAADFDPEELRAAILASQLDGQKFRDFTRRAVAAGVAGYTAFLRGKRVTYWGRAGDHHVEWFPGSKP